MCAGKTETEWGDILKQYTELMIRK